MGRVLKLINVLCLLLAVNIRSKLIFANTTLTIINSNVPTESATNQETTIELTTFSSIVTLNTGMPPETTFMKSKHNRSNSIMFECSLELADVGVVQKIQALVAENKELIFIHFHLLNQTTVLHGPNDTIYDILTVVRAAGGFGNELLEMHPQFEQLSVGTLMFGVEHVNIALRIISRGCSRQHELQSALLSIVTTELNMLQMGNDNDLARLCQMHAENVNGLASFYYNCCTVDGNGEFVCSRLEINQWMNILLVSMNICYVLAFLCSPLLIPTSWYDNNANEITLRMEDTFEIKLSNKNVLTKIKKSQTNKQIINYFDNKDTLKAKEIKLKMLAMNTVSTDYVHAGIFHYLYRTFIKCQVKDHDYVKDCCHTDVCICSKRVCFWHKCLQPFMQHIFLGCLLLPWVIRIIFYNVFESADRNKRETFALRINLKYPNMLQWSLTYSLKPNHPFFICIYVFIVFVPFSKTFLKSAMNTSGININIQQLNSETRKFVRLLVLPCRKLGVAGCLISPFYLLIISPLVLISFILPYVPIIKVSYTLLDAIMNGLLKIAEEELKTYEFINIVKFFLRVTSLIMVFLAVGSSMFICFEVVIFFLQIVLYFAIGIILNASSVLTYATFAGMLLFYVYDTLRNVQKKYESFSRAVIEFSISYMKNQVKKTFSGKNELQHSAFQFKILNKSPNDSHIKILFDVSRKKLLLKSKQPCLFFDENCKPYLNEKAFFTMCYMKVIRAPGSLWTNYKSAAINFLVIVFFLFSVVIIVLAFGKTQGIPGTYQAIATLGGGLIPLVLRRYFFKSDDVFDFETNHFLVDDELQQLFETYHETWEIVDIPVDTDHEDGETAFVIEISEARDNSQSEDAKSDFSIA